jgi:hypothetical protein
MFLRCFVTLLVCALVPAMSQMALGKSYIGIVNQDGAPIRSGPGKQYYSTDVLRRGDAVEVHRIDEGGWCAIRPPAGSFCWVAGQHLRMTSEEGVAEVAGDDVLAYVGSRVRDTRDVVQVRLQRGELVEVLGIDELPLSNEQGTQTWYRVAPPAGEFRWVHLEFVDRQRQPRRAQDVAAADGSSDGGDSADGADANSETEDGPEASDDSTAQEALAAKWRPLPVGTLNKRAGKDIARRSVAAKRGTAGADRPRAATFKLDEPGTSGPRTAADGAGRLAATDDPQRHAAPAARPPGLLAGIQAAPLQPASATEPVRDEGSSGPVVAAAATSESNSYAEEFEQLDVEFSLMVARPTAQWDLQPLMTRAQEIARRTPSPVTREKAHALLDRMRRFEHLQKGTAPLGGVVVPTVAATRPPGTSPGRYGAGPPPVATGRYGATTPTNSGLPKLLAALESLMPSGPPQAPGGPSPPGFSASPPAAGVIPTPPAASVHSAPPDSATPEGLSWGRSTREVAPVAGTVAAPSAAGPAAGHSPPAGAMGPGGIGSVPAGSGQSVSAFGRLAGAVLYPFGSGQPTGTASPSPPSFDGRGWLMPLVSRKGGSSAGRQYVPPYVLTDEQGNIVQFITPAPGVNLHRYVNQEIGVFGQHRSLEHLQQPHLTASRIVQIDRHRR